MEQGHLSASLAHMANIAYRTGNRQLFFDGKKEQFIDNESANKQLKDLYRGDYHIMEKI